MPVSDNLAARLYSSYEDLITRYLIILIESCSSPCINLPSLSFYPFLLNLALEPHNVNFHFLLTTFQIFEATIIMTYPFFGFSVSASAHPSSRLAGLTDLPQEFSPDPDSRATKS